jgi:hypothetical protein
MLATVAVLAVIAAVGLVLRWAVVRVDQLGRVQPFPVISTVLALGLGVAAGIPVLRHHQVETRLARVSSSLARRPVSVRCESLSRAWVDAHPEWGYGRFDAEGRLEPVATLPDPPWNGVA